MFENMAAALLEQGGPELYQAVLDELKSGIEMRRMQVEHEVLSWSQSPTRTSRGADGIGFCEMDVPADVYFNWDHYEKGFWQDKASRMWFLRRNPQFRVKYEPKAMRGWAPTLDRSQGGLFLASARTSVQTMKAQPPAADIANN